MRQINTNTSTEIRIAGLTPLTTIDFPGRLAAVIFTQGCPWRCRYCHNWPLLDPSEGSGVGWDQVVDFLMRRQGLLDGVVFSGGEPLLWEGLADKLSIVKTMGYETALHTNGYYSQRLQQLIEQNVLDWLAMDIKAPFGDYARITGISGSGDAACESVNIILRTNIPHEFRMTVHPGLLSREDVLEAGRELKMMKGDQLVLQKCRTRFSLDPEIRLDYIHYDALLRNLKSELEEFLPVVTIR